MTERTFVEKIQDAIHAEPALRGACVFKHAETLTSGIPDLSVSFDGTSWIEVKYLRKGKRLKDIVKKPLQIITAHQLSLMCNGRCWFVVYEDDPKRLVIWQPRALFQTLYPKLVAPPLSTPGVHEWNGPVWFQNDGSLSVLEALHFYGAIFVHGHLHKTVTDLLIEAATQ